MNVHGGAGGSSATADDVADEIIETLRRWVDEVVVPESSPLELADEYPTAMAGQMEEFGLFGATIPESHGGLDLDHVTYARVIEELSRGWMSLAGIVNSHLICAKLIDRFGTDEQRDRLLAGFRWLLVDEYQDIGAEQYGSYQLLPGGHSRTITAS